MFSNIKKCKVERPTLTKLKKAKMISIRMK